MSRHLYSTTYQGKPVTVALGFDRPCQGFFLTIGSNDGAEADIYCNLDDPLLFPFGGLPPTLNIFLKQLQRLRIELPTVMIDEVRRDQRCNVGNRVVLHGKAPSEHPGGCDWISPLCPSAVVENASRVAREAFGPMLQDPPDSDTCSFWHGSQLFEVRQTAPGVHEVRTTDKELLAHLASASTCS